MIEGLNLFKMEYNDVFSGQNAKDTPCRKFRYNVALGAYAAASSAKGDNEKLKSDLKALLKDKSILATPAEEKNINQFGNFNYDTKELLFNTRNCLVALKSGDEKYFASKYQDILAETNVAIESSKRLSKSTVNRAVKDIAADLAAEYEFPTNGTRAKVLNNILSSLKEIQKDPYTAAR